ncbi:putative WRKY transcription factor 41 [Iris pallida]|uniref:WRKY transcription factor 41 n=1 Tax=Iris pallida TaxID=29817 RepID=A0AAX6GCU7_IRIPA|nr:putative WRKY transcription factor 41 [Iris pallida]
MDRSSNGCWDLTKLLAVLSHGHEQTRQLEAHLDDPSVHHLVCKSLARQIESTFQTAISMVVEGSRTLTRTNNTGTYYSPPSGGTDSLQSKSPDRAPFEDDHERMETCNKRKISALRWTRQVRVCPAGGIEEPLVDGHSWRKYGQKDILGAKYPRGYYRCTHRNSRGCLATKQVQRSDEDPFVMEVTYRGAHTCTVKHEKMVGEAISLQHDTDINSQQNNDLLLQLHKQAPLAPKTDDLNSKGQILDSSSFSFEPSSSSAPASCMQRHDSFIDSFMLARTSEMNYLPLSRCGVSNYGAQETELAANTPMSDMDFCFRQGDFGADFPFDGSSF